MPNTDLGHALGWDSPVTATSSSFTLLPEGDYDYTVIDFQRGQTNGTPKMASSPQAILTLRCSGEGGSGDVRTSIVLNSKVAWKITEFFKSCYLIPADTPEKSTFTMPWDEVIGAQGRCHLGVRKWTGNDGQVHETNEVTKYLEPKALV